MIKLFKVAVLSLLLLLAIFIAVIESGPGQRAMQKKLIETLADLGIQIHICSISLNFGHWYIQIGLSASAVYSCLPEKGQPSDLAYEKYTKIEQNNKNRDRRLNSKQRNF